MWLSNTSSESVVAVLCDVISPRLDAMRFGLRLSSVLHGVTRVQREVSTASTMYTRLFFLLLTPTPCTQRFGKRMPRSWGWFQVREHIDTRRCLGRPLT